MVGMLISFIGSAIALYITTQLVPGFNITNLTNLIIATIVIALINAFIKPVLKILTLPINLVTLGLFSIVINAVCLLIAAWIVPGFEINGFITAIIGAVVLSITSTIIGVITKSMDKVNPV